MSSGDAITRYAHLADFLIHSLNNLFLTLVMGL
jgi:hypothetical protein